MCFRLRRMKQHSDDHGAIYLHDNSTICKTVKCNDGDLVQNIIKDVCCQLGIQPLARFFFALCDRKTGIPLSPFSRLSAQDCRSQYQLRVFVNISNSWYLQHISQAAYDYYYKQSCDDFVNNRMQPHITLTSSVWMSAIYMSKEAKNKGKKFEELLGDVELYMPNFLYRRYQRDCKVRKKLKEVFDRFYMLSVDDGHYINKFLEVYEKDAMCGKHAFPLKQSTMSLLRGESQYVAVSWKEGVQLIAVIGDVRNCQELICSISNISSLRADFESCRLEISKTDKTKVHINFKSVSDLVGFSVTVQTYWWLKVDGNHVILTGDIAPDERTLRVGFGRSNHNSFCYSPIMENSVEQILQRHFAEGNFLIRESRTVDDAYTLTLSHNKQIMRYRIICDEDGTCSFKDLAKSKEDDEWQPSKHMKFPSLYDLIKNHKHRTDGLPTLLRLNISPEVAGRVPLMYSGNYSNCVRSSCSSRYSGISMQCHVCRQKCNSESVHLCDDCHHFYYTDCVVDLPNSKRDWHCQYYQPTMLVRQTETAQHGCHTTSQKGDFVVDKANDGEDTKLKEKELGMCDDASIEKGGSPVFCV